MGIPLVGFFHQYFGDKFRMEDVEVKNISASLSYPRGPFVPCALIASNDDRSMITLNDGVYVKAWSLQLPEQVPVTEKLTSVFIKIY